MGATADLGASAPAGKYCAVIGQPVAHSLSPLIHLAAYQILGLDWDYRAIEVAPENLEAFLQGLDPNCQGLSVTMPHKRAVMPFIDHLDGLTKVTSAVNTICFGPGVKIGFNTDVGGIVRAFRDWAPLPAAGAKAVILGGGATASSALAAFTELGASEITVISRRHGGPGSAYQASLDMGLEIKALTWSMTPALGPALSEATWVFNTVPAPAQAEVATRLDELDGFSHGQGQVFMDAVYNPWPSPLRESFARAQVVGGWIMLLEQAVAQIKLFTGHEVPSRQLLEPLEAALRHRGIDPQLG